MIKPDPLFHNYKLTIAYDGTHYHGWQIQPNGVSIQELLQKAIKIILREDVHVIGSGRTDAGAHAQGQVAHFKYRSGIDLYRFHASINGLLPPDIRVKCIEEVPLDFHAQYSAISKTYHYHLYLDPILDPCRRLYVLHVKEKIDLEKLEKAAQLFIGTHNFTSFSNEAHRGTAAYDAIRTLQRLDLVKQEGGVRLEFEGDGFLYKMVRNIVGILLEVASHKRSIEEILLIFKAKDRRKAGKAVSSKALYLMNVEYPPFPKSSQTMGNI